MSHSLLSDQQLNQIEERFKSLQKLVTIDVEALVKEVREYRKLEDSVKAEEEEQGEVLPDTLPKSYLDAQLIWDDLPLTLETKHIQQILDIGQRQAYDLMKKPPFHFVTVGKIRKVSKDVFRKWLEEVLK
jgi:hypothetical protein